MKSVFFGISYLFFSSLLFAQNDTTTYVSEIATFKADSADLFAYYIKAEPCKGESTSKVALIIAGSGPTDGNGNNPFLTNNTYKLLAEELGRNGISSIRYDKRGIGNSKKGAPKEENLRFEMYVNDANTIVNGLINYKEIIVIGHSEGSLIGMMVAAQNKHVTKYISIAGPGSSADQLIKEQYEEQPEHIAKRAHQLIDSVKAGIPIPYVPVKYRPIFRPSVQGYMHSWFKYDPQVEIKKLKIPILLLQGTKDLQVKVLDAQKIYLANNTATLKVIENMNHVLRIVESDERSDNIKTYNNPSIPLSKDLLNYIVNFCK